MKKIIFLGSPGSGKGVVSQKIAPLFNIPHISTGELLRQNLKDQTKTGIKAKEIMEKGELVPDNIIIEILKERISKQDCKEGFILDGFPRNTTQAEILNQLIDIDIAVHMNVTDNVVIERNSARISCKECGKIYNLRTLPPKDQGVCDDCQGEIIRRKDDEPEIMKERLEVYKKQTSPLIDFYKKKEILTEVFCDSIEQTPEQTFQKVMEAIDNFFKE